MQPLGRPLLRGLVYAIHHDAGSPCRRQPNRASVDSHITLKNSDGGPHSTGDRRAMSLRQLTLDIRGCCQKHEEKNGKTSHKYLQPRDDLVATQTLLLQYLNLKRLPWRSAP